jgi:hypothetical protein
MVEGARTETDLALLATVVEAMFLVRYGPPFHRKAWLVLQQGQEPPSTASPLR